MSFSLMLAGSELCSVLCSDAYQHQVMLCEWQCLNMMVERAGMLSLQHGVWVVCFVNGA